MLLTEYTSYDTSIALASSGANQSLGQKIQLRRSASVEKVYLYLTRAGSPGGYLQAKIYSDESGPKAVVADGESEPVLCSSISTSGEWVEFSFSADAKPKLTRDTPRYIVLEKSSGYTYAADAYVAWGCDQTDPHYTYGAGYTYDGATWAAVSTDTDFTFKIYSNSRVYIYPSIRSVEGMSVPMTDSNDSSRFNHSTLPSIEQATQFADNVSDMIDGWLKGAGVTVPLSTEDEVAHVRNYANYCMALECELVYRTTGFYTSEGDTRAAALRKMCYELRTDIKDNGPIVSALKDEQGAMNPSGSDALTAGHIESDERDDDIADADLVQPIFRRGMWDN